MDRATAFAIVTLGVLAGVVAGVVLSAPSSDEPVRTSVRFLSGAPSGPSLPTYHAASGWASLPKPTPSPDQAATQPVEVEESYEPVEESYEPSYESTPEYSPEPAPSSSSGGHQHEIELTP